MSSFLVEPKNLDKVNRFGEILEVKNSSELLLIDIKIRSKLITKLKDLNLIRDPQNAE
jgi:hypothetical protein